MGLCPRLLGITESRQHHHMTLDAFFPPSWQDSGSQSEGAASKLGIDHIAGDDLSDADIVDAVHRGTEQPVKEALRPASPDSEPLYRLVFGHWSRRLMAFEREQERATSLVSKYFSRLRSLISHTLGQVKVMLHRRNTSK